MTTLYLNRYEDDASRRASIFSGNFYLYTDLASAGTLCAHAKNMVQEAFEGMDPERAQFELSVPAFVERVSPLKSEFTNCARTKDLCRAYTGELGCDPDRTYFDLPRLRVAPSGDYLTAGVSYVYQAHRDTWYAHPVELVNTWMPVYPVVGANAMSMFVGYFDQPVKNASEGFDYDAWVATARFAASEKTTTDDRPHPLPQETIDTTSELRIAGGMGDVMMFSGCHLHATAPNVSGVTRFSVDLRTVNLDDIEQGRGPRNVDSTATGSTLGDFLRVSDLKPLDLGTLPVS